MAKLLPGMDFTGSMGNLSFYKRADAERTIVRSKGGPSRDKIRSHPSFDIARRNNKEFGGRSRLSGWILRSLHQLKPLSDYNMASALNALLKSVQHMDTESEFGKRNLQLSRHPEMLEGFPLNKRNVFEAVVRSPLKLTLSKEERKARIELPQLSPHLNFFPVDSYPVFRWQACLAVVPDLFYQEPGGYQPPGAFQPFNAGHYAGEWYPSGGGCGSATIELNAPLAVDGDGFSLLLVVGIGFGVVRAAGGEGVKYAGAGKILRVV